MFGESHIQLGKSFEELSTFFGYSSVHLSLIEQNFTCHLLAPISFLGGTKATNGGKQGT